MDVAERYGGIPPKQNDFSPMWFFSSSGKPEYKSGRSAEIKAWAHEKMCTHSG